LKPSGRGGVLAGLLLAIGLTVAQAQEGVGGGAFTGPGTWPPPSPSATTGIAGGAPVAPTAAPAATMRPQLGTAAPSTLPQAPPPVPGVPGLVTERLPRPPAPPTDFQRFVEAATGRLLPIFGAAFFAEPELRLFGDQVPVAADYVVGAGDELIVRVWGSVDADLRAVVDRNGQVSLPRVGTFTVAGVRAADLESSLRAQIGRLYTNFSLSATLGQLRGVRVFVVGPAARPGPQQLASPATALSALASAGGPSSTGSMRKVTVRRGAAVVGEIDLYDLLVTGDKSKDVQLVPGDVVVVHPAGPRVAITGATDGAAIYELKPAGEAVGDVLRYAGGAPVLANTGQVQLERIDPATPRAPRQVETFGLDAAGLGRSMRDGDVLTLLPITPRFANAVTLRGPVAQPLRYPHTPGMRIRDLIPDREALISPDFYRRKNQLVQVEPPRDPAARWRDARSAAEGWDAPRAGDLAAAPAAPGTTVPSRGPAGGVFAAVDPTGRAARLADGSVDRVGAAGRQGGGYGDPGAGPADPGAIGVPDRRRAPAPLFTDLNWDYAVIERLNEQDLSTQVIPFNLGRAILQGDPAHNLELRPGDVVTVYSQRDLRAPVSRQTRLVTVDGEVQAPGVYQLQPGETLRSLIQRAGGLTPQAYVYGLEFTREETRRRQQENLASAIARLEALSATQAARDAANRRDDQQTTNVSNAATQAQLARLRQLQPNGRIALELSPDATLEALPEVPLEHADRISVPARPGFVTVAGAVVNSNAFLWRPDRTAGDYMRLAGVDEAADPANTFILRADGTVTSGADRRGWFARGGVESERLEPGDAVIVPNQLDFETFGRALVRNLKDWSQILANFGIGAAAIQTLRNN
jgi:protein involved in polysaccharide export with SLBB domain